jgi:phosphoglycolate phosphatase
MKKNIELVVFDWSGVISDDRKLVLKTHTYILRNCKKPEIDPEQWLTSPATSGQEFLASQGVSGSLDELADLYEENLNKVIESGLIPEAYPDAQNVLQYLKEKGKKISVLSCHPVDNVKREANHYNLISFCDLIRGSSKDKANDLQNICRELGVKPEHTLFMGDTIHDIRIAKKVGVNSCGICHGYHSKEMLMNENPDLLLDCLSDLKKWLS